MEGVDLDLSGRQVCRIATSILLMYSPHDQSPVVCKGGRAWLLSGVLQPELGNHQGVTSCAVELAGQWVLASLAQRSRVALVATSAVIAGTTTHAQQGPSPLKLQP